MRLFEIDSDIRNASTLPSEFYTDPAYFEMSKDRIFARTWQLVSRTSDLQTLTPQTILPGFLDEPVLLARKLDKVQCLSNVCTHRGNDTDRRTVRCEFDPMFISRPPVFARRKADLDARIRGS